MSCPENNGIYRVGSWTQNPKVQIFHSPPIAPEMFLYDKFGWCASSCLNKTSYKKLTVPRMQLYSIAKCLVHEIIIDV